VNAAIDAFNANILNSTPAEAEALEALGITVVQRPENLKNYEIGLKATLFDGRARFSAAAFIADWTDQFNSRSVVIVDNSRTPPVTSIVGGTANSGNTRLTGLEADLVATPVDGVTLNLAAALIDTDIKEWAEPEVSRLTGVLGDGFRGNSLPFTSRYSANVGMQLDGNIVGLDEAFFVRGDLSYKSKQYVDTSNLYWIAGRTVVNARLGYRNDKIAIEVFATNLFNNRNYTSASRSTLLDPSNALAVRPTGALTVGLPPLRLVGVRTSISF
jgi:iron complex outermembrane receptor protein